MTDAEIAGIMGWRGPGAYTEASLRKIKRIIERVRADEREACAMICDELEQHWSDYKDTALLNGDVELSNAASGEPRAARSIAAAIRNRAASQEAAEQQGGEA
jgi:hypothetical protein